MKTSIFATAVALFGLASAYEIKEDEVRVDITTSSGRSTKIVSLTRSFTSFDGMARTTGGVVFKPISGQMSAEIIHGPEMVYCDFKLATESGGIIPVNPAGSTITQSKSFSGVVEMVGAVECTTGPVLRPQSSSTSRQPTLASRFRKFGLNSFLS